MKKSGVYKINDPPKRVRQTRDAISSAVNRDCKYTTFFLEIKQNEKN